MDCMLNAYLIDVNGTHEVKYDISPELNTVSYYLADNDVCTESIMGNLNIKAATISEESDESGRSIVYLSDDLGKKLKFSATDQKLVKQLADFLKKLKVSCSSTTPLDQLKTQGTASNNSLDEDEFFDVEEDVNQCQDTVISMVSPLMDDSEYDQEEIVNDSDIVMSDTSVIMHLIKQLKRGMDLTSITLPTFILERRSLLEMFADFFSHPDIFCRIPTEKDPKERFILVVKWYLSSFHAGRNSKIAKKPYNPILGEIFRCFFALSVPDQKDCNSQTVEPLLNTGPVPWVKPGQISFLAEQVSHHPPISAFYAEDVKSKIFFNSHIHTKSKFLGTSVAAQMIGKGTLILVDFGEKYVMTYPTGYGRSILTKPKFEMCGDCEINCEKTGYSATIEFIPKPYFGGKFHEIKAQLCYQKSKPFMTITGEWNGVMTSKDSITKQEEVFFNTKTEKIYRKYVKKKVEKNESRELWSKVTSCLKNQDIDGATVEKTALENKQRSDAKERLEKKKAWIPAYFEPIVSGSESGWYFKNNLNERLKS